MLFEAGLCVVALGGRYATLPAFTAIFSDSMEVPDPPLDDPGTIRSIHNGGNTLARILALVVGIMAMGRHVE